MKKSKKEIGKIYGHILVHDDPFEREIADDNVVEPLLRPDKTSTPHTPEKLVFPERVYAEDFDGEVYPLTRVTLPGIKKQDPGIKQDEDQYDGIEPLTQPQQKHK